MILFFISDTVEGALSELLISKAIDEPYEVVYVDGPNGWVKEKPIVDGDTRVILLGQKVIKSQMEPYEQWCSSIPGGVTIVGRDIYEEVPNKIDVGDGSLVTATYSTLKGTKQDSDIDIILECANEMATGEVSLGVNGLLKELAVAYRTGLTTAVEGTTLKEFLTRERNLLKSLVFNRQEYITKKVEQAKLIVPPKYGVIAIVYAENSFEEIAYALHKEHPTLQGVIFHMVTRGGDMWTVFSSTGKAQEIASKIGDRPQGTVNRARVFTPGTVREALANSINSVLTD